MRAGEPSTITLMNVASGEVGTVAAGDVDPGMLRLLQPRLASAERQRIELPARPGCYLAVEPLRGGAMFTVLDRGGAGLVTCAAVGTARGAALARAASTGCRRRSTTRCRGCCPEPALAAAAPTWLEEG